MKHARFLKMVCLLPGIAAALCLSGCGPAKLDARQAAGEFFLEIGESRFQDAYDSTTFAFQARTSFKNYQAIARELGLSAGTMVCHWSKEENKENEVKLTGEVTSAAGNAVPVIVTLIQERGAWRVFSLHTPSSDTLQKEDDRFSVLGKGSSFNSLANQELPPPRVTQKLVREGLELFDDAIRRRSFRRFYAQVSNAWQNQLTETQLQNAFQSFIDTNVTLGSFADLEPIFDTPPVISSDGILFLTGHYETKPHRTEFILRFIYELPHWKLYGLDVKVRD